MVRNRTERSFKLNNGDRIPSPSRSVARRRSLTLAPLTVTGFAPAFVVRGSHTTSAALWVEYGAIQAGAIEAKIVRDESRSVRFSQAR